MPSTIEINPRIEMDQSLVDDLLSNTESQVIVHCTQMPLWWADRIRVWPTTVLIPVGGGPESKLIHVEGISLYPGWCWLYPEKEKHFTLIFESLPRDCTSFDLFERIPEPGGFHEKGIVRNKEDIYHVIFNE